MGFRFRKSINLGLFKINFSKSGIGFSFGIPGLRLTQSANGKRSATASIPGTGISYRKELSKSKAVYKTCPSCRKRVSKSAKYCASCGGKI